MKTKKHYLQPTATVIELPAIQLLTASFSGTLDSDNSIDDSDDILSPEFTF